MKVLVQTGYVTRHNPSLAGNEYDLIGTIALDNLIGEEISTKQEVYQDKKVNTYYAVVIELRNCYETIVLNDKPIENKFSNMPFIILYKTGITDGNKECFWWTNQNKRKRRTKHSKRKPKEVGIWIFSFNK